MNKLISTTQIKPTSHRSLVATFVAAALLTACAADSGPSPQTREAANLESPEHVEARDVALNLIATVEGEHGSLKFYEPEPGILLEVETGLASEAQAVADDVTSVERYEQLTGKAAPAELVGAQERATLKQQSEVTESTPVVVGGSEDTASHDKAYGEAYSESWFHGTYCVKTDRYWPDLDVSPSMGKYRTNDGGWSESGLKYMKAGVYVYRGDVTYRYSYSSIGSTWQDYGVPTNYYAGFRSTSSVGRTGSSRVWNATGDGYAHCVNFHY